MTMLLTPQSYSYDLDATKAQINTFRMWCLAYRRAYNRFVAERYMWWHTNKTVEPSLRPRQITAIDMSRDLTHLMRVNEAKPPRERDHDLSLFRAVPRHLVTRALATAHDAFDKWFKRGHSGFWSRSPRFKSSHDSAAMRCGMQVQGFRWNEHGFRLPKVGFVRTKEPTSRLKGRPVRITIIERAGKWSINVCCLEVQREIPERTDTERVGVDLGVRKLATLSTGEFIKESHEVLAGMTKAEKRIKRLQRSLSRKENEARANGCWDKYATSKGYQRVKRKFQTAHAKAVSQRRDRSNKLTTRLSQTIRTIVIEDLSLRGMLRSAKGTREKPGKNVRQKAGLNRAVASKCFGAIRRQLEYKAKWYGATVETVPRFYPSSKTCSSCGNVKQDLGSKETYHCDACGLTIDRDLNAAINIRDFSPEAQEKLSQGREGERVDCPKRASGSRAGLKGRKATKPEKHVQDPQGKPDAGTTLLLFSATLPDAQTA